MPLSSTNSALLPLPNSRPGTLPSAKTAPYCSSAIITASPSQAPRPRAYRNHTRLHQRPRPRARNRSKLARARTVRGTTWSKRAIRASTSKRIRTSRPRISIHVIPPASSSSHPSPLSPHSPHSTVPKKQILHTDPLLNREPGRGERLPRAFPGLLCLHPRVICTVTSSNPGSFFFQGVGWEFYVEGWMDGSWGRVCGWMCVRFFFSHLGADYNVFFFSNTGYISSRSP